MGTIIHQSGKGWNDGEVVRQVETGQRDYKLLESDKGSTCLPPMERTAVLLQGG